MENLNSEPINTVEGTTEDQDVQKAAEKQRLESKKKKNKKRIIIGAVSAVVFVLFMALFGVNLIRYGIAYLDFSNKKYESASAQFEKLETFLNSPDMVVESDYKQALVVCESDPKTCIGLLEVLLEKDHNGVQDSYNEWTYTYASTLLVQKNYTDAIAYFNKVSTYKDSKTKVIESYYQSALAQYAQGEALYAEAFADMEKAAAENYLDAQDILDGWIYDYAVILAEDKQYALALDYLNKLNDYQESETLKTEYTYQYGKQLLADKQYATALTVFEPIATYKDTATQIKEANYQIALVYYTDKNYTAAYPLFKDLMGYRDSTTKYYVCQDIVYAWNLTGLAVSNTDNTYPATPSQKFSVADPYHVTAKLTGGVPGTSTDLKLVLCYPSSCQTFYYSGYKSGSLFTDTFGWDTPSIFTPRGEYTFTIYAKVRGSWKYMNAVSIRVLY